MAPNIYLALAHFPVVNKNGAIISSAVTNLDLHDISRAAKTYGVKAFFVVTPLEDQKRLVKRIISHWTAGAGATYNPARRTALELIHISDSIEDAVARIGRLESVLPKTVATGAGQYAASIGYARLRRMCASGRPYLLIFGTAWGLAPGVFSRADHVLEPIGGRTGYNHLAVRSAAAIILDRLLGAGRCNHGLPTARTS